MSFPEFPSLNGGGLVVAAVPTVSVPCRAPPRYLFRAKVEQMRQADGVRLTYTKLRTAASSFVTQLTLAKGLMLSQRVQELQESADTLFGLIDVNLVPRALDHRHSGIWYGIPNRKLVAQWRQWTSRRRQHQGRNLDLGQERCDVSAR